MSIVKKIRLLVFITSIMDAHRGILAQSPSSSNIFVVGGWTPAITSDVEVVDIGSNKICNKPTNFPYAIDGAVGYSTTDEKAVVCGGWNGQALNDCHYFSNNSWTPTHSMIENRRAAALLSFNADDKNQVIVTGGLDKNGNELNSVEVLTENGWQNYISDMPLKLTEHCLVSYNSSSIMVIGGSPVKNIVSRKTFILNIQTKEWTEGPELKYARSWHSCTLVTRDQQNFSIVVAGGQSDTGYMSSVEILDVGSNAWKDGPELPTGIFNAVGLTDSSGKMVLVGGHSLDLGYLDTIYQLNYNGSTGSWIELPQKLKTERHDHVAFFVPDDFAECS